MVDCGMGEPANPYQPPRDDETRGASAPGSGSFRIIDGDTLVVRKGTALPPICLWNGEPCSDSPRLTTFSWAPTWVWIFIVSPLLLMIVYLLARKRGQVSYFLGPEAQRLRKQGVRLVAGALLLALPIVGLAIALKWYALTALASLGILVALLVAAVRSPSLQVARVDALYVFFKLRPSAAVAFARALVAGTPALRHSD